MRRMQQREEHINFMDLGTETAQNEQNGTGDAQTSLQQLLDKGFGGDTFMLALALGREEDQIKSMLDGDEDIDEDLEMKINGIAQERDIEIT
jgi:hypothetical protein